MEDIEVRPGVRIPAGEIDLSFARSGGPGGQHVNTAATKVMLRFDLEASRSLDDEQKAAVRRHLGSRITASGELLLEGSEHKSQTRNREAVLARFRRLLGEALAPPSPPRRPTRPSRAAKERRLDAKRRRGERKRLRRPPPPG